MKTKKETREKEWRVLWDKIWAPSGMFLDPYLTHLDTRIGGIFASCQKHGIVVLGQRRLAKMCRASLRDVSASIKRLTARGYISCSLQAAGLRNTYCLTNPMYAAQVDKSTLPIDLKELNAERGPFCPVCYRKTQSVACPDCHSRQQLADAI